MLNKKSENKIIAFFLIFTLGTMILQINQFIGIVNAQSNAWYVGKGVKPDTYYTYQITECRYKPRSTICYDYLF